jgi:membrane associated rhomboid family serine protease
MIPLRDENPTRTTPYLTWLLVAANVLVYIMQATGGMYMTRNGLGGYMAGWTVVPAEITSGRDYAINGHTLQPAWLTIFTAMFLHGGLLHLGGNMVYLIIFGNNIEDALGRAKYLAFYLLSGVAAAALQIVVTPNSTVPMLGASGAIAGVLGGYFLLYPKAKVNTLIFLGIFITTVRIPAFLLLGFWIVSQFFSHYTESLKTVPGQEEGGVAYLAHIGGFLAGMLLIKLMGGKASPPPPEFGPYGDGGDYAQFPPARRYGSYR